MRKTIEEKDRIVESLPNLFLHYENGNQPPSSDSLGILAAGHPRIRTLRAACPLALCPPSSVSPWRLPHAPPSGR